LVDQTEKMMVDKKVPWMVDKKECLKDWKMAVKLERKMVERMAP